MLLRAGTYSFLIFPKSLGVLIGYLVRSSLRVLALGNLYLLEKFLSKDEDKSPTIYQEFLRWITLNFTGNLLILTKNRIAWITSVWLNLERES